MAALATDRLAAGLPVPHTKAGAGLSLGSVHELEPRPSNVQRTHTKASEHMSQKELGTAAAEDFCVDFVAMAGNEADFLGLQALRFQAHSENPRESGRTERISRPRHSRMWPPWKGLNLGRMQLQDICSRNPVTS